MQQAQFYSAWARAVAFIFIDGDKIRGYLLGKITPGIPIFDCDVSELANTENILQFSYEHIRQLKKAGIDNLDALTPIRYKRKLSSVC